MVKNIVGKTGLGLGYAAGLLSEFNESMADSQNRSIKEQTKAGFKYGKEDMGTLIGSIKENYNSIMSDDKPVVKKSTGYGFLNK